MICEHHVTSATASFVPFQVDVLCHLGRVDVVPMALSRGLSLYPGCVALWLVRLRFIATTSRTVDEVKSVIEEALNSVKEKVFVIRHFIAVHFR